MLSSFDDYFVHQTPRPVAIPATTDRNAYDRFWFNGYTDDGGLYLGSALLLACGASVVSFRRRDVP